MIHTESGGWIANVETQRKIPFLRVRNTHFMDAWVRVPDKGKDKSKDRTEVDGVDTRSVGFTSPRR